MQLELKPNSLLSTESKAIQTQGNCNFHIERPVRSQAATHQGMTFILNDTITLPFHLSLLCGLKTYLE